jgi:hypothetical protein
MKHVCDSPARVTARIQTFRNFSHQTERNVVDVAYTNPAEHPPEAVFKSYCHGERCAGTRDIIEKHLEDCVECRTNVVRTMQDAVDRERQERQR